MRILTTFILLALSTAAFSQITHKRVLYFEDNSVELMENTAEVLDDMLENAPINTSFQFELVGLLDQKQSTQRKNEILKERASKVQSILQAKGIKAKDVTTWSTAINPIMLPLRADKKGLQAWNVRTTIREVLKKKPVIFTPLNQLQKKKVEKFKIDPTKKLKIKGKQGTKITAQKACFMFPDGTPVEGEIKVELKEYYSTADWIMEDLVTTSGNRMIESGGMIHLAATSEGRAIVLKPGEHLNIELPRKEGAFNNGMQTFIGSRKNGQMDWQSVDKMAKNSLAGLTDNNINANVIQAQKNPNLNLNNQNWNNNRNTLNVRGGRASNSLASKVGNTLSKKEQKMDVYLLESSQLGWINCDRFYDVEEKTNLMVNIDTSYQPIVRLVFTDINSVMPGFYGDANQVQFANIPVGQKATLIAYSIRNNQPYYEVKPVKITKDGVVEMKMKKSTTEEMKRAFKKLNRA